MARSIYGADGSAQVVSLAGTPTLASATVKSARTGGVTITDIQNMSGANLGGIVTPDSRGQIIFQGPDNSTATYWLDFGDGGPRWAVRPVDLSAAVTAIAAARELAQNAAPGSSTPKSALPYVDNSALKNLALALDGLVIPRFASQTARNTAFPSPADGDRCYRTDLHAHQTYRAVVARWVTDTTLIQETTLAADAGAITWSSIPAEWKHLIIRCRTRMVGSTATNTIVSYFGVRLNNDAGANYAYNGAIRSFKAVAGVPTYEIARDGSAGNPTSTTAAVYGSMSGGINNFLGTAATSALVGICPGSSNTAGLFGGGELRIDDYTNAATRKNISGNTGFGDNTGGAGTGYMSRADIMGGWQNNAAINRIDLVPAAGTAFASGSFFSLYGMG
jgi:hypothetical protein